MHLYIVDDDPLARRMAKRMLAGTGIECEAFAAVDFLRALPTLPFGCVLLDIHMPDHDGLAVLEEILRVQPFPVVMASGSTDVDDAITAFRRGAVHFLRKPFSAAALRTALAEAAAIGLERKAAAEREDRARQIRLTPRETQVLETIAAGQQSKQAAWQLGLSVRTVEMHRANLLAKMGAMNASHAAVLAKELRLLPAMTPPMPQPALLATI